MKNVSILVPESSVMQAIADPQYLFSAVNQFLAVSGKTPLFQVQLVGFRTEIKLNDGHFTVTADKLLKDVQETDLVVIPACWRYADQFRKTGIYSVDYSAIRFRAPSGLTVCWRLSAGLTGLLNGKNCSTHWVFTNEFRQMFPEVEVVDGSIVTKKTVFIRARRQLVLEPAFVPC